MIERTELIEDDTAIASGQFNAQTRQAALSGGDRRQAAFVGARK